MTTLKLNNIGDLGLNSDVLPFELPLGAITSGNNFRIRNGFILPFFGSVNVIDKPNDNDFGFITYIHNKIANYWIIASRNKIWRAVDSTAGWIDISSELYPLPEDGELDWIGDQLGQLLIMNNPSYYPEYWANETDSQVMKSLPFSPTESWKDKNLSCRSMRAHKNFLVAMNLSGTEDAPNGYRISHPSVNDGIPLTWDTTARDSIAVKGQLGSDGGQIVDGMTLRDSFIIYSQDAIDVLTFNPSSEFYWTRKELSSTVGLLSSKCLTEVKGVHYLIVDGDVVINDGNNINSIMYKRIQKRFNSRTNEFTQNNSFIVRNDALKEVWCCVPEEGSKTASVAYVFNWKDNTWSIRELPESTASIGYGSNPAVQQAEFKSTWRGISQPNRITTWANVGRPWGTRKLTAVDDILVGVNQSGVSYDIDPKSGIQESDFNTVIERTDFPILDHKGNASILRVFPTATGAEFTFQIGTQQHAGGAISWSDELNFNPGQDRYLDFRETGELMSYRIKSIGSGRFKFSGFELEYVPAGLR